MRVTRAAWIIPLLGGDSTIPLLGGVRGGPFPVPRFHEDKFHEDKGREISVNISRITALPHPKSPPKRGLSNLTLISIIFVKFTIYDVRLRRERSVERLKKL